MALNKITRPDRQFVTPTKLDMQYWYFDGTDYMWSMIWGVAAVAALVASDYISSLMIVLFTLVSLIRRREGRLYYWVFDKGRDLAVRYLRRGKIWTSSMKSPFYNLFGTLYDVTDADEEHLGLVRVDTGGTYAGVVISKGDRTASKDPVTQLRRRTQLAFRLAQHDLNTSFSWLYSARPLDLWPWRRHMNNALNPQVYLPELDEEIQPGDERDRKTQAAHQFFNRHIGEKETLYTQAARSVTEASTVMVTGNKLLPNKDTDTVDYRAFENSPVVRALNLQRNAWQDYGAATHIATYSELKRILRAAWDAKDMLKYYKAEDQWLRHDGDEPSHLPQQSVRAYKDHLIVDGNYITVVEATTLPGISDAFSLKNLYGLLDRNGHPIDVSIVLIGTSANAKGDRWWVNLSLGVSELFRSLYMTGNRSYESLERDNEAEARKNLIGGTQNRVYTFNFLCFVYGTTEYESEQRTSVVMNACNANGLTPKSLRGEHRLLRALKSAWGANNM